MLMVNPDLAHSLARFNSSSELEKSITSSANLRLDIFLPLLSSNDAKEILYAMFSNGEQHRDPKPPLNIRPVTNALPQPTEVRNFQFLCSSDNHF